MYQALYRKYRPKTFDDVVGQGHITDTLKAQVVSGRLSHAYLFTGTRGTGKTSCAKILAKAVNCESPVDGNPCNRCRFCRGIDEGSITDVVEMDAASNNGVDNVRQLRDEAVFSPAAAKKRVYIVDEVHMLSVSAFNALLKILEEPPSHLMFILATTELNKVPATILSRCQRHAFKRLDTASIVGRLQFVAAQEQLNLSPDAASLIAGLSEGGMRDALSMLDQCAGRERIDTDTVYSALGLAGNRQIGTLLGHIANHETAAAIALFESLWQEGKNPATVLGELSTLQRDLLMCAVAPKSGRELLSGGYDDALLQSFRGVFSTGQLIANIDRLREAVDALRTGQARTVSELCLISLCEPGLNDSVPMLRERIAVLERKLAAGVPVAAPSPPAEAGNAAISQNAPARPPIPAVSERRLVPTAAPPAAAVREDPPAEDVPPFDPGPPPPEEPPYFPPEPPPFPEEPPFVPPGQRFQPEPSPAAGAPAAAASQEAPTAPENSGAVWEQVVRQASAALPGGISAILADPEQVSGVLSGDTLTLRIRPGFAMNMLDRPDVLAKISAAAAGSTGSPVRVRVTDATEEQPGTSAPAASRLDELAKFPVVKFQ